MRKTLFILILLTSAFCSSCRKERTTDPTEAMMKTMNETREAYNNGLKKIMTDDQFSKYEEDQKKMMQRRPRQNNKRK